MDKSSLSLAVHWLFAYTAQLQGGFATFFYGEGLEALACSRDLGRCAGRVVAAAVAEPDFVRSVRSWQHIGERAPTASQLHWTHRRVDCLCHVPDVWPRRVRIDGRARGHRRHIVARQRTSLARQNRRGRAVARVVELFVARRRTGPRRACFESSR